MNAGVTALTISLLDDPTGRRGHRSSAQADQSLRNESDTIAMSPTFASALMTNPADGCVRGGWRDLNVPRCVSISYSADFARIMAA